MVENAIDFYPHLTFTQRNANNPSLCSVDIKAKNESYSMRLTNLGNVFSIKVHCCNSFKKTTHDHYSDLKERFFAIIQKICVIDEDLEFQNQLNKKKVFELCELAETLNEKYSLAGFNSVFIADELTMGLSLFHEKSGITCQVDLEERSVTIRLFGEAKKVNFIVADQLLNLWAKLDTLDYS